MHYIHLDEDIKPLSEFRANAAAMIHQVQENHRPLVLTQRGRSAAVVLSIAEYQRLVEELLLLRDVRVAESQLEEGKGTPQDSARAQVMGQS